jgi:hypothetical protein
MQSIASHIGPWHCDAQAQQAHTALVKEAIGWNMAAFDSWLFSNDVWRSFPKVRQLMLEQRMQLSRDCEDTTLEGAKLHEKLLHRFTALKRLAHQCKNCPADIKKTFVVPGIKASHKGSKLSAVEAARIQRQWQHLLDSGQKYGALTLLAKQYGVSCATIKKVLQAS